MDSPSRTINQLRTADSIGHTGPGGTGQPRDRNRLARAHDIHGSTTRVDKRSARGPGRVRHVAPKMRSALIAITCMGRMRRRSATRDARRPARAWIAGRSRRPPGWRLSVDWLAGRSIWRLRGACSGRLDRGSFQAAVGPSHAGRLERWGIQGEGRYRRPGRHRRRGRHREHELTLGRFPGWTTVEPDIAIRPSIAGAPGVETSRRHALGPMPVRRPPEGDCP